MARFTSGLLDRFQQTSNRGKALLALFLLLVIGFTLYTFYFSPQLERLQVLRMERAEAQQLVKEAYDKGWNSISSLQKQAAEYERQIDLLRSLVPSVKDTPGLLVDIYALTTEYGLLAKDGITFGEIEERDGYAVLPMELELLGRSEDIYGFVCAVESFRRLLGVREIKLEATTPGFVESTLKIDAYILGDITPDPEHYPFMVFEQVTGKPYNIFRPGSGAFGEPLRPPGGYPSDPGQPSGDGASDSLYPGFDFERTVSK